ncbi:unnamed protein product [Diplocarpon coronariae]
MTPQLRLVADRASRWISPSRRDPERARGVEGSPDLSGDGGGPLGFGWGRGLVLLAPTLWGRVAHVDVGRGRARVLACPLAGLVKPSWEKAGVVVFSVQLAPPRFSQEDEIICALGIGVPSRSVARTSELGARRFSAPKVTCMFSAKNPLML